MRLLSLYQGYLGVLNEFSCFIWVNNLVHKQEMGRALCPSFLQCSSSPINNSVYYSPIDNCTPRLIILKLILTLGMCSAAEIVELIFMSARCGNLMNGN